MYISSHGKEQMISMEYLIVAGYSECTQGMDQTGNTAANSIEKYKNLQNTYASNSFDKDLYVHNGWHNLHCSKVMPQVLILRQLKSFWHK
jgi:hypothetical protein